MTTPFADMKTLVLATHNSGKVRELQEPLAAFGLQVIGLSALRSSFSEQELEVEETGTSFTENALLKARTIADLSGYIAIADDSGILVDALNGAPGIYSARYSQEEAERPEYAGLTQDERNIQKLLQAMRDVPPAKRTARFCSAMAAAAPKGERIVVQGFWEGQITAAPIGSHGFGYDPVFYDPQLQCTAAQLEPAQKMAISHRAKALQALLALWPSFWQRVQAASLR